MRNKYKDKLKQKNNINSNKQSDIIKSIPINSEQNIYNDINNNSQRNTISHIQKQTNYKKLELNNLEILNIEKSHNHMIQTSFNEDKDFKKIKKDLRVIGRKNILNEKGIIVKKPYLIREKLYNKKTEDENICNTDINKDIKVLNDINSYREGDILNSENKINFINDSSSINNNENFKKIEVNLLKNRLKTINTSIKNEKLDKKEFTHLKTERSEFSKEKINNNRSESNDLLSFFKKYRVKLIDTNNRMQKSKFSNTIIRNNEEKTKGGILEKNLINVSFKNKKEKSPFKFLIHQANKNSNLSKIFNSMYDSYKNNRTKILSSRDKKNNTNYMTLEQKSNINDSSEKIDDFSNISSILKEYNSEKISKRQSKFIKFKIKENFDSKNNNLNLENNNKEKEKEKENEQINVMNKIVNNNTFNTTFNIYKINNIVSKKNSISNHNRNKISDLSDVDMYKLLTEVNNNKEKLNKNSINELLVTSLRKSNENTKKKINVNTQCLNIEKFYSLFSKFKDILNLINNYQICYNECKDFILFFFDNNIYESFVNSFKNTRNKSIIINIIKIEILCFFLCYDSSFYKNYNKAGILFKTIFELLFENFIINVYYILENIIRKNNKETYTKLIMNDLYNFIKKELKINISVHEMNKENYIIRLIEQNYIKINNFYQMIIDNLYNYNSPQNKNIKDLKNNQAYKFPQCLSLDVNKLNISQKSRIITNFFFDSFKTLNNYNIFDLKIFFDKYLNKENINLEKSSSNEKVMNYQKYKNGYYRLLNNNFRISKGPKNILPSIKPFYKYSLIINLDSLIYIPNKYYPERNKKILVRPGLTRFLKELKEIYELILFSNHNFDYVSNILRSFEQGDEKYFDHILTNFNLYSDVGIAQFDILRRNINNFIIIDNFKSFSNINDINSISIKQYYGNINEDKNILINLMNILKKIRNDIEEINDIKIVLEKYRYIIFTTITNSLI